MPLSTSPTRIKIRDFLICLSVANLLFLRRWYDLEVLQSEAMDYFRSGPADNTLYWATLISIALTSIVFFALARLIRRFPDGRLATLGRAGFLVVLAVPLETVRRFWNYRAGHTDLGSTISLLVGEALLIAGVVYAIRDNPRILRVAERVALYMVAALPVFAGHYWLSRSAGDSPSAWVSKQTLPMIEAKVAEANKKPRRLIWLLFDEFDQRLAFDERQPGVALPELDRLRAESMVAKRAEQTAGWTLLAVPSLLSGRVYEHSDSANASSLMLTAPGSTQQIDWHDEPNVFRRARDLGVNAGIVGWHHPYCRVLGDSVARCFEVMSGSASDSLARDLQATDMGLWNSVWLSFHLRWETFADIFRPNEGERAEHQSEAFLQRRQQEQFLQIRNRAFQDARDPKLGLLYVHFPTPHLFAIYNAKRKDFTLSNSETYFDNLALVDRTVGELRQQLEQAGLWDSTSILISSDHGLRHTLWKGSLNWTPEFERLLENGSSATVPFILKLAGEQEPATYNQPFSAVVTGDLALSVLSGEVETPRQAAVWLATHTGPKTLVRDNPDIHGEAAAGQQR
jgi:hypothetical protein